MFGSRDFDACGTPAVGVDTGGRLELNKLTDCCCDSATCGHAGKRTHRPRFLRHSAGAASINRDR